MRRDYSKNRRATRYFHSINVNLDQELARYAGTNIEVILDGDWNKLKLTLDQLRAQILQASLEGQNSAAEKFRTLLRRNMRSAQTMGFAPLSPKTIDLKSKRGHDLSMFMASHTYYNSIEVIRRGNTIRVGIKPWTRNPYSKMTVAQIAVVLEYGSQARGIPARPLWRQTWKQFGGPSRVRSIMAWHIHKRLKLLGFHK